MSKTTDRITINKQMRLASLIINLLEESHCRRQRTAQIAELTLDITLKKMKNQKESGHQQINKVRNNTQYQNNAQQQQKIQKSTPNNNETISEEISNIYCQVLNFQQCFEDKDLVLLNKQERD
ncbi:hypothetical protein ABPG72_020031 [Tetrahymena utriculariae]